MEQKGADHKKLQNRVNRIEGQIRGISSMLESQKYCIDILTQVKAVRSALKSLELEILEGHLYHCVKDAIGAGEARKTDETIEEIMMLLKKSSKS